MTDNEPKQQYNDNEQTTITITCPECSEDFEVTQGFINAGWELCEECQHEFNYPDTQW